MINRIVLGKNRLYNIHGVYVSVAHGALAEDKIHLDLSCFEVQECNSDMPDIQIVAEDIDIGKKPEYLIGN